VPLDLASLDSVRAAAGQIRSACEGIDLAYMREHGFETIKTTSEAEEAWTEKCYQSAKGLLIDEMQDSWFFGSTNPENIRGRFLLFAGGVPEYRRIFAEVAAKGYEGFELH